MSILPKAIYAFSAILVKISMAYFTNLEQMLEKFIWNQKKSLNSLSNHNINKVGWIIIPAIKLYYKTTVIKTVGYWHKNRHKENGTEYRTQK